MSTLRSPLLWKRTKGQPKRSASSEELRLKKYGEVLVTFRQSAKELGGDQWTLGDMTGLAAEGFWTWSKTDTTGYDGHPYLDREKCVEFDKELWFELGKCMWMNHWSVYQDHMKYVHNNIVKPFKVKFIYYANRVREMHEIEKYLPPILMKRENAMAANWMTTQRTIIT